MAPPVPPKKTLDKISQLSAQPVLDQSSAMLPTEVEDPSTGAADSTDICALEKRIVAKNEGNSGCVSSDDAVPDSFNYSTELGHFPENSQKAEEKPAVSGHHSDDGVFGSLSEDTEAAAMTNSQLSPDVSDDDEDDIQVLDANSQVGVEESPCQPSVPNPPPKPWVKAKSASHGDLLLKSSSQDVSFGAGDPSDDVAMLKLEVSVQVEKTNELLFRLSKLPNMGIEEDGSVNLLAEAVEKLKRADVALTEGQELGLPKNESNRKSW